MTSLRALAIALSLLFIATEAYSGVWRVAPIRIDLDRTTRSTVVRISNSGSDPVRIQINTVAWQQAANGEDIYTKTTDLLAFPKIATIKPNEDQIIRIGIKRPALQTEKSYRLFIQEIPPATPKGGSSVAVALRVGIPVFAAPLQPETGGAIQNITMNDKRLSFAVDNSGNITNKIEKLSVTAMNSAGERILNHDFKPWYLLPGTSIERSLKVPAEVCHDTERVEIVAHGDKLKLKEELPITSDLCQ